MHHSTITWELCKGQTSFFCPCSPFFHLPKKKISRKEQYFCPFCSGVTRIYFIDRQDFFISFPLPLSSFQLYEESRIHLGHMPHCLQFHYAGRGHARLHTFSKFKKIFYYCSGEHSLVFSRYFEKTILSYFVLNNIVVAINFDNIQFIC